MHVGAKVAILVAESAQEYGTKEKLTTNNAPILQITHLLIGFNCLPAEFAGVSRLLCLPGHTQRIRAIECNLFSISLRRSSWQSRDKISLHLPGTVIGQVCS